MNLFVRPAANLKGTLQLPASKSYSIRAFLIASCGSRSFIINPSDCDDAIVARKVSSSLGAKITRRQNNCWEIRASHGKLKKTIIDVQESGTVLRFLLPLICLRDQKIIIKGTGTLKGRPNHFLTRSLRSKGVSIRGQGSKESIPIVFKKGELSGGKIEIDGTLSSQFISALLITCPLLKEDSHVVLKGKTLVSTDYIEMTLRVLKMGGIQIKKKGNRHYKIKGRQSYKGLKNFIIPSDYGLAAFLLAAAALISSNITLRGHLEDKLIQADGQILKFLKQMGVKFQKTNRSICMKGPASLKGGNFSLKSCPDLVPIMAILALFAKGKTRLYNIRHARAKESDRISDLRKELLKVGAKAFEKDNELIIYPQNEYRKNCTLNPHKDHRLAMAFCILGLKLGVRVKDIECVSKSYPGFVRDFKALGAKTR